MPPSENSPEKPPPVGRRGPEKKSLAIGQTAELGLTLVTRTHKLVVYRDSEDGELYDLAANPDQFRNLWDEAHSADLKSKLLLIMNREQLRVQGQRQKRLTFE